MRVLRFLRNTRVVLNFEGGSVELTRGQCTQIFDGEEYLPQIQELLRRKDVDILYKDDEELLRRGVAREVVTKVIPLKPPPPMPARDEGEIVIEKKGAPSKGAPEPAREAEEPDSVEIVDVVTDDAAKRVPSRRRIDNA